MSTRKVFQEKLIVGTLVILFLLVGCDRQPTALPSEELESMGEPTLIASVGDVLPSDTPEALNPAATASAAPPLPTSTPDAVALMVDELPRPKAVELEPAPPGVLYFEVERPFEEMVDFYRTELSASGWTIDKDEDLSEKDKQLIFIREDWRVTVLLTEVENYVSVLVQGEYLGDQ